VLRDRALGPVERRLRGRDQTEDQRGNCKNRSGEVRHGPHVNRRRVPTPEWCLCYSRRMLARFLLAALIAAPAAADPFSFVALGDTTYAPPADNSLYGELIDAINAAHPAFSIHVGDTKGYGDCGRTFQQTQLEFFNRFAAAVIYTPGNNEWADCWKANRGSADPTEILALMRGSSGRSRRASAGSGCRWCGSPTRSPSSPSSRRTRAGPTAARPSRR
jgi:hypothetical protein